MGRWSKPHWARLLLPQSNPGFFTSLPNQSVKQFCYISPNSQSFDLHESFLCVPQFFNISNIHQFKEQEWQKELHPDPQIRPQVYLVLIKTQRCLSNCNLTTNSNTIFQNIFLGLRWQEIQMLDMSPDIIQNIIHFFWKKLIEAFHMFHISPDIIQHSKKS